MYAAIYHRSRSSYCSSSSKGSGRVSSSSRAAATTRAGAGGSGATTRDDGAEAPAGVAASRPAEQPARRLGQGLSWERKQGRSRHRERESRQWYCRRCAGAGRLIVCCCELLCCCWHWRQQQQQQRQQAQGRRRERPGCAAARAGSGLERTGNLRMMVGMTIWSERGCFLWIATHSLASCLYHC